MSPYEAHQEYSAIAEHAATSEGDAGAPLTHPDGRPLSWTPTIVHPVDGIYTGSSLTLWGSGMPGGNVEILDGSERMTEAPVDDTGYWTASLHALLPGSHRLSARSVSDGRSSAWSPPVMLTVRSGPLHDAGDGGTIAPAAPTPVERARFTPPPWARVAEPWFYLAVLGLGEYISDVKQPVVGLWIHALLAAALIIRGAQIEDRTVSNFYLAASIMPVVRLVSFAISPHFITGIWFYAIAESPMLAAAIAAARVTDLPLSALGICRPRSLLASAAIIATGPLIGWLESRILHPTPLATSLHVSQIWLPSLLLILCTGLVEEIVFRGVLQHTATRALGVLPGIFFCAMGWALLHIGWLSVLDVLFVFAVGMVWGYVRLWNRDTIDLSISHGLANVVLFVVVPNLPALH